MTAQIVVKLNKDKFGKLLRHLAEASDAPRSSTADLVGHALFLACRAFNVKRDRLGGLTAMEHFGRDAGLSHDEVLMGLVRDYRRFLRQGRCGCKGCAHMEYDCLLRP
jgi:hypothetical protein